METLDSVTVEVGEENITPSVYKLMHSTVLLTDLTNHTFANNCNGDKVKVYLRFKNVHKMYWCQFQCGQKVIDLIGGNTVVFSGFRDDGSVRAFKLNDSNNLLQYLDENSQRRIQSSSFGEENNVITVTVFNAHEKQRTYSNLQTDCCDGRKLVSYNDKEKSDINYITTDKYYAGSYQARFYIILYKNYKKPVVVY